MKKFFVYFDKKVIINSAEEAEEFINSLTDKNEPGGRKLELNYNVHALLKKIYQDEEAGRKLQTTGCSPSSFIYCYPALADTPEECEKAIIAKEAADRKRRQDEEIQEKQRIAREINERKLYKRRDHEPVTGKQVYAVIMSHPDTFVKSEGRIRLMI